MVLLKTFQIMHRLLKALLIVVPASMLAILLLLVSAVQWQSMVDEQRWELGEAQAIVINDVAILDVSNTRVIARQNVYLADGRIKAIEDASQSLKPGYKVVPASGHYLSPGLIDSHVHVYSPSELALNLGYGVTTVRNLRGFPVHLRWRDQQKAVAYGEASLLTSSPVLDGPKYAHLMQEVVSSPEQARQRVRLYKEQGFDSLKVYSYLDQQVQEAIFDEARKIGLPVAKHGPHAGQSSIEILAGAESLEHLEDIVQGPLAYKLDIEKAREYLQQLNELEPYLTPTLASVDHFTRLARDKQSYVDSLPLVAINPFFRFLNTEFSVNRWLAAGLDDQRWNEQLRAFLLLVLQEADRQGITLLLGSDAGTLYLTAGYSAHQEMAIWEEAGLDKWTILQAATVNPARAFGLTNEIGQLKVGLKADLLLLEANPLEELGVLQSPVAVIKAGRIIEEEDLLALRQRGMESFSWFYGLGVFVEDLWCRWLDR